MTSLKTQYHLIYSIASIKKSLILADNVYNTNIWSIPRNVAQ